MSEHSEKNYYQLLGVEKDASPEQIKEAYREIARVFHPDSNFFDEIIDDGLPPESLETFKAITEAYSTLSNPEKRKLYNESMPPELNGWDQQSKEDHKEWVLKKSAHGTASMGTFGSGAFSSAHRVDPDIYNVQSVAEMLSKKRGLCSRFWSLFGL